MTRSRTLTALLALITLAVFAAPVSAHYDPQLGRWLERDPLGMSPGSILRTIRVGDHSVTEPALPRFGSGTVFPLRQYSDGMNLYQYVRGQPVINLDPDGMKKYTYEELAKMIGGCHYAMPANSTDWRLKQKGLITSEIMLCLFWKESSFDTEAKSYLGYYGLGQMGKDACDDVDKAYKLPSGTCWRRQQSNNPCQQIANSIAYLHHLLVNKKDFGHDGSLRGGLRKYGPTDAGFKEYADPILRCAKCIKNQEKLPKGRKKVIPGTEVQYCSPDNAQNCFGKMNKEVRKRRGS